MKKPIVISLGGSLIAPEKMNSAFLKQLRKTLSKHYKKNSFIIVCGGGVIARKYISALREDGRSEKDQSLAGIRATCLNAEFMMEWFRKDANEKLPKSPEEIKGLLKKNKVVFCCAFRYVAHTTSDDTAAKLAKKFKAPLINLSNVDALYTKDPSKYKDAKKIPYISWKEFEEVAHRLKYKAGQHFIIDQKTSSYIKKNKIKTFLLGNKLKNLSNLLSDKKFNGTIVGP